MLSIIVPIYNAEKELDRCIQSILNQTYSEYELILVDDGSTDESLNICKTYSNKNNNIKVIHQENAGQASARKEGFTQSVGDYVCFVDSDDWIDKNYLLYMHQAIKVYKVDIVIGDYYFDFQEKSKHIKSQLEPGYYNKVALIERVYPTMIFDGHMFGRRVSAPLWDKMYKRSLIDKNIFSIDEKIYIGEDAALVYSSILDAKSIFVLRDAPLYHYCYRPSSVSNVYKKNYFQQSLLLYEHFINKNSQIDFIDITKQIEGDILSFAISVVSNEFQVGSPPNKYKLQALKEIISNKIVVNAAKKVDITKFPLKEKIVCFFIKHKQLILLFIFQIIIQKLKILRKYIMRFSRK